MKSWSLRKTLLSSYIENKNGDRLNLNNILLLFLYTNNNLLSAVYLHIPIRHIKKKKKKCLEIGQVTFFF